MAIFICTKFILKTNPIDKQGVNTFLKQSTRNKMNDVELRATLAKLVKQIECIDAKISQMPQVQIQVSSRLLPTLLALQKIGSGTATQVSRITQRCRAFESKNLNELCLMGAVTKEKVGHEKVFKAKTAVDLLNVEVVPANIRCRSVQH